MWQNGCPWDAGYGGWSWLWFSYQLFWLLLVIGGGYLLYKMIKGSQAASNNRPYGHFEGGSCPKCRAPVESAFLRCPECGTQLKRNCPECGKIVKTRWEICPYCETGLKEMLTVKT